MKKAILISAALWVFGGLASADTSFVACTNPNAVGANGADSFAATTLSCPQFTVPLGDFLASVQIQIEDSFDEGVFPGTNTFDFNFTAVDPDVALLNGPAPNTCVTSGVGSATTCQDIISGGVTGGGVYQLGNVITTNLLAYIGAGTFNVASVSALADASGGSLNGTGQLSSTAFVTYTFFDSSSVPEPATFAMLGAGLLSLGIIARKRKA